MSPTRQPALTRLIERAQADPEVLAAILFGSQARGEAGTRSDTDIALVLTADAARTGAFTRKQLDYLAAFDLDLSIFQQLPLAVRVRVLGEGVPLYVRDEDALYEVALATVQAFELFKPIHRRYLEEVARG